MDNNIYQKYRYNFNDLEYSYNKYNSLLDYISSNKIMEKLNQSNDTKEYIKQKIQDFKADFKEEYSIIINTSNLPKEDFKNHLDTLILILADTTDFLSMYFIKLNSHKNYNKKVTFDGNEYKIRELIDIQSFIFSHLNSNDFYFRTALSSTYIIDFIYSIGWSSFVVILGVMAYCCFIINNYSIIDFILTILIIIISIGLIFGIQSLVEYYNGVKHKFYYLTIKNECLRLKDLIGNTPYDKKKIPFNQIINLVKDVLPK